jgi:acetylornithine deacetylase/succinyl-diaminopimelate desuccinylase-like protein
MLAALALTLALAPGSPSGECLAVEVSTTGRSAHGSAIMPASAPHELIRALDRLTAWAMDSKDVAEARIVVLAAGPAINVIPERATAVVEISSVGPARDPATMIDALRRELDSRVEVRALAEACQRGGAGQ